MPVFPLQTMNLPHTQVEKAKFSWKARLHLISTLNRLPLSRFLELEFALSVPSDVMPGKNALQGERSSALLNWAESPKGAGLTVLISVLKDMEIGIEGIVQNTDKQTDKYGLKVTLEGNFDEVDRERIIRIAQEFQVIASDSSVQINRCSPGSIEIELHGSKESIEQIKDWSESYDQPQVDSLDVTKSSSIYEVLQHVWLDLSFANLSHANLSETILRSANLSYANLSHANLRHVILSHANLSYANLRTANLTEAHLRYTNFRSANLIEADFSYAHLRTADLRYADLSSAILSSANLSEASLFNTNLNYANLGYANFSYTNLKTANLIEANLRYTNLRYADLQDADLSDAILKGTVMTGCRGLTENQIIDFKARGAIFEDSPDAQSPIYSSPKVPR